MTALPAILPPAAALAHAVALLIGRGFAVSARNTRGDSVYLRPEGCAYSLRVSNHARTPKQRRNHPGALVSLVIRQPRRAAQVADLVAAATRDFAAARARRELQASGEARASGEAQASGEAGPSGASSRK
ncbi:hypothetical protein [Methylobacterium planeticum]|uniref:hypothetical protein n=1 Tax=Methylobacterium planeticum TaxID=2615211 RepID=UPI001FEFCA08|nr:hypothetical protein [Methylobacterium planeticum]